MIPQTFDEAFERVKQLVQVFNKNEKTYLSADYSEAQARLDFIDKFWIALGWDVNHEVQTNPYEQEVKVERKEKKGRRGRADYAFLAPNFRDVLFFVEAKKPRADIDTPDNYFQTIRYGWNSQNPLAVLTDFEHLRILDCRYKPDIETAIHRAEKKFHYLEYAEERVFREIYHLFSREAATSGAIDRYAAVMPKPAGKAHQRTLFIMGGVQRIDDSFLQELDSYREDLARSFKNKNPHLNSEELTEVTQRTIDRLVFMRFLEDKLIEPEPLVENLGTKGKVWQDFITTSHRLNAIYNGIIFKKHALLDAPDFQVDESTFAGIRENLAHTNSPYDFNAIPIHILGSIYERFLGKVIVATDKRARVEEKPEVRKAGGVYYTPEYIVTYIVENTVGKVIEGKTPEQIAKLRFADIACGSGSFLLGVYDLLLRYHTAYYNESNNRAKALKAGCVEREDGTLHLGLRQKKDILLNNIYGVDLDAQAVEVAQLSLFLKLLEDETTSTAKSHQLEFRETMLPSLDKNVLHGNALIEWDVLEGQLFNEERRNLFPLDYKDKFKEIMRGGGFDAIVGNPPYIRIQTLQETTPEAVDYFKNHYESASKGNYDIYVVFVERALSLLNDNGRLGYILPHKFFNAKYGESLRSLLSEGKHLSQIVHFGDQQVFAGATTYTCLLFLNKAPLKQVRFVIVKDLNAWREAGIGEDGIIPASKLGKGEWNLNIGEGATLFDKLNKVNTCLGAVAERMSQGIRTSANEIYVLDLLETKDGLVTAYSKQLDAEVTLERRSVLLFLQGREIKPYQILPSGKIVVFPYRIENNRAQLIEEGALKKQFPLTYAYLIKNKAYLRQRERGRFAGSDWYGYGRSQNIDLMLLPKMLVPDIADRASFALDESGDYAFTSGYGITFKDGVSESPHFMLGLLNSNVLDFYLKRVSTTMRGGFFRYFTQFIEKLPIRRINFRDKADKHKHDRLVNLVEQMITAKPKCASARSDKDRAFYENMCAALSRQINALVYELYGLTDEEIAIIEAG